MWELEVAAEEVRSIFRQRDLRQTRLGRVNRRSHHGRSRNAATNPGHLPLPGEGPLARAARRARSLPSARRSRPTASTPSRTGPPASTRPRPRYLPKQRFLMLMRNERLARLRTRFDDASHTLVDRCRRPRGRARRSAHARRAAPRSSASSPTSAPTSCAGRRRCCTRPATASPTWRARWSRSSISPRSPRSRTRSARRSIRCASAATSTSSGWPAWHEFDLLGQEIAIGPAARLKIVKRIVRCAATDVDPDTGIRDLAIPQTLMQSFGHADCGVYGEVVEAGEIAVGDELSG